MFARGDFAIIVGILHGFYIIKQPYVKICFKTVSFAKLICKRNLLMLINNESYIFFSPLFVVVFSKESWIVCRDASTIYVVLGISTLQQCLASVLFVFLLFF